MYLINLSKMLKNAKKYLLLILFITIPIGITNCDESYSNIELDIDNLINSIEEEDLSTPQALEKIDSLLLLAKKSDYKSAIAKAYSLRGSHFYSQQNFTEAYNNFKSSVRIASSEKNNKQLGIDYENLGRVYNRFKDGDSSIYSFKKSAEFRKLINDSTGIGVAYHNTGFIFWQNTQYDSAIVYFEKALEIRKNLPNKDHLSSTLNNLGTIYYQWAIYDEALMYYFQALTLNKELDIPNNIAINLVNIGLAYKETAKSDEAIKYFIESLPFALKSDELNTVGYAYNSLGSAYLGVHQDSSIYYFNKSLNIYRESKYKGGEIIALKGIGQNYIYASDFDNAREYFYQILRIAEEENIPLRIAEANKFLGDIYLKENNYSKAKKYFEDCLDLSQKHSLKSLMSDSYKNLSIINENLGDNDSALYALKQYEKLYSEINNEDIQRRIDDLKNKFEFEKYQRALQAQQYENEKQGLYLAGALILLVLAVMSAFVLLNINKKRKKNNLLLRNKNELIEGQTKELEIKNSELVESNEAKDKLFSIIAHDLKNPFSTLLNYSFFLKEEYHELSEKERIEFVSYMYDTTTKTYELLENLLNLSASRTGKISYSPTNISPFEIFKTVISLYEAQSKNKTITISNNVKENLLVFADQYMIEIVLRNLINNAIKYTHVNGNIAVEAKEKNSKVMISIEDSGVGMDSSTVENIFNINVIKSQNGTKGERGTGLGLGLCKEFVEKNNGSIEVTSELNKGSKFIVYLPAKMEL